MGVVVDCRVQYKYDAHQCQTESIVGTYELHTLNTYGLHIILWDLCAWCGFRHIYIRVCTHISIYVWSIAHFKLHVLLPKLNWNLSPKTLSLLYFSLQSWFIHVNFVDVFVCFFSSVIMVINYPCAVRFFRAAAQPWILVHIFHTWKMLQYTLLFGCVQYVHLQSPWIHYIFA